MNDKEKNSIAMADEELNSGSSSEEFMDCESKPSGTNASGILPNFLGSLGLRPGQGQSVSSNEEPPKGKAVWENIAVFSDSPTVPQTLPLSANQVNF